MKSEGADDQGEDEKSAGSQGEGKEARAQEASASNRGETGRGGSREAQYPRSQTPNLQKDTTSMNQTSENGEEDSQSTASTPYQRSQQTSVRPSAGGAGGAYPGAASYPGSSYTPGAHGRESGGTVGDRRLTIGAGITMSGEIESCDYLLVEGTVEAALKGANLLDVAESGVFYGTVEIDEAVISGRFEGDITVHGRLTVSSTGVITGSIAYKELAVESGAIIDGKLTPLQAAQVPGSAPTKSVRQARKQTPAEPRRGDSGSKSQAQGQSPANSDGELFGRVAVGAE